MRVLRSALLATTIFLATRLATAQQSSAPTPAQPCSTSPQPTPCAAPAKDTGKAAATDRFPFPGDNAAPPASAPAAPDAPSGKAFPFPGDTAAPAAPSSSSSSSSSTDASDPNAAPDPDSPVEADTTSQPSGRRLLKRVNPIGTKLQSTAQRESEDLSVARFYTDSGDLQGAYLRSQDAVNIVPDDPDAHCSLANAALQLNKRDQAIAEFKTCLKLDPIEKEAKNARKQLARLK